MHGEKGELLKFFKKGDKTPFWVDWKRSEIISKPPRMEALRN
jgi:hypothetical protein